MIYRITGAFFFGAAASIGAVLDRIAPTHRALILDFSAVPFIDSTAANTLVGLARKAARRHVQLVLTGTSREMRQELFAYGIRPPLARFDRTIETALAKRSLLTRGAGGRIIEKNKGDPPCSSPARPSPRSS